MMAEKELLQHKGGCSVCFSGQNRQSHSLLVHVQVTACILPMYCIRAPGSNLHLTHEVPKIQEEGSGAAMAPTGHQLLAPPAVQSDSPTPPPSSPIASSCGVRMPANAGERVKAQSCAGLQQPALPGLQKTGERKKRDVRTFCSRHLRKNVCMKTHHKRLICDMYNRSLCCWTLQATFMRLTKGDRNRTLAPSSYPTP